MIARTYSPSPIWMPNKDHGMLILQHYLKRTVVGMKPCVVVNERHKRYVALYIYIYYMTDSGIWKVHVCSFMQVGNKGNRFISMMSSMGRGSHASGLSNTLSQANSIYSASSQPPTATVGTSRPFGGAGRSIQTLNDSDEGGAHVKSEMHLVQGTWFVVWENLKALDMRRLRSC